MAGAGPGGQGGLPGGDVPAGTFEAGSSGGQYPGVL